MKLHWKLQLFYGALSKFCVKEHETVLRGYTEFSRNDAEFSQNLKLMVEFYVLVI